MPPFLPGLISFSEYFVSSLALAALFCLIYIWLTPHREFTLIGRDHNASAATAFGGTMIGYSIALAGAIHNAQSPLELIVLGLVAIVTQIIAYGLARLAYRKISSDIEANTMAAAIWLASVSISIGIISAACMGP